MDRCSQLHTQREDPTSVCSTTAALQSPPFLSGASADRMCSVSYGEEKPKYDNSREETQRLNRRAGLDVNLQR